MQANENVRYGNVTVEFTAHRAS